MSGLTQYQKEFFGLVLFTLLTAQAVGVAVNTYLPLHTTQEVFGVLQLTHVRNYGGIFGLAQGFGWVFSVVATLILAAVTLFLYWTPRLPRYEFWFFGLIVGGGLSNIVDRLVYGSVIDYIDLRGIPYWNFIFNLADFYVHLGVWPLLIAAFFFAPDEDEVELKR